MYLETNMAAIREASKPCAPLEDSFHYLPCSYVAEYRKGQVIYNQDAPSTSIYLILEGKVKVSRVAYGGRQVLVNLYGSDEIFGESAFVCLNRPPEDNRRPEGATALENTKLMTWTVSLVEELIMRQPRLGIAFLQMLAQRTTHFTRRIESFSCDSVAQRLARCLINLSERMGTPREDGSVKMAHFTHELLSEHIGTSREIVSHHMSQFRVQGYLQYSRKGIVLYRDAFQKRLRKDSREPANFAPDEPTAVTRA
jgi:CRP/FNR family transcriptional regulator